MGNLCSSTTPVKRKLSTAPVAIKVSVSATKTTRAPKQYIPKAMKRLVWDTYIGEDVGKALCTCCNHVYIRQIEFHCGHVVAEANGGQLNIDNLRPICAQCNLSMRTMNMEEFKKMFARPI